jgi:hypothetical protein
MKDEGGRLKKTGFASFFSLHSSAFRLLLDPFADQGGFAKACGSGDDRKSTPYRQAIIQPINQTRARDYARPGWGDIKFCG